MTASLALRSVTVTPDMTGGVISGLLSVVTCTGSCCGSRRKTLLLAMFFVTIKNLYVVLLVRFGTVNSKLL
ncbi:MAG: hypothetical protein BWY32_02461 [bacterium ADurb.Bin243]|nr:MAG: hypothetical protein BWY32_02461 [bacterium ADurb.Bin243]